MKIHTVGTSNATFFQKVCQFVSFMASPKQPQSVTSLVMASNSVVKVKKTIISSNSHAPNLRNAPVIISTPTKNSATIKNMAMKVAIGTNQSKLIPRNVHVVRYSVILYEVPSGSTPFTKLEKRNTTPTTMRAITFKVQLRLVSFTLQDIIVIFVLFDCLIVFLLIC